MLFNSKIIIEVSVGVAMIMLELLVELVNFSMLNVIVMGVMVVLVQEIRQVINSL